MSRTQARGALDARMTEDELLTAVLDMAKLGGWRAFHVRDSKRGVVQGPGCLGFPDLVMSHPGGGGYPAQVIYRELKTEKGKTTADQIEWGRLLLRAGCDWSVWRPRDLDEIEELLMRPERSRRLGASALPRPRGTAQDGPEGATGGE